MINIKLELNKRGEISFKAKVSDELKENIIIKRVLFESKIVKSNKKYPYVIPMRFFIPIVNNVHKSNIKFDKDSVNEFLEFSDFYEERSYYIGKANANYMKKWREEDCPKIFKIIIDKENLEVDKFVAFERLI